MELVPVLAAAMAVMVPLREVKDLAVVEEGVMAGLVAVEGVEGAEGAEAAEEEEVVVVGGAADD